MSLEEQQRDELDALAAIYYNEYELINDIGNDNSPKFAISINSEKQDDDSDLDNYKLTLIFSYPKTYPDVGPEIEIQDSENLEDRDELEILDVISDMVPDNLGLAMVFTLVSKAQEWINTLKDRKKVERIEEAERRKQEHEEAERRKFEGTRVTVESFISWKLKFDAEMAELSGYKKSSVVGKMTGKEMFLIDKNLITSDLSFADGDVDDGDVQVDESLFEADDDLELDEIDE